MAKEAIAIDLDDVYELPPVDASGEIPDEWQTTATYNLEMAVRCPHCDDAIRTIRIVGMSRSQVAFTSTLPRKGRIAVCPECDRILPAELSGLSKGFRVRGSRFGVQVRRSNFRTQNPARRTSRGRRCFIAAAGSRKRAARPPRSAASAPWRAARRGLRPGT